jgi:hypothetical protein
MNFTHMLEARECEYTILGQVNDLHLYYGQVIVSTLSLIYTCTMGKWLWVHCLWFTPVLWASDCEYTFADLHMYYGQVNVSTLSLIYTCMK